MEEYVILEEQPVDNQLDEYIQTEQLGLIIDGIERSNQLGQMTNSLLLILILFLLYRRRVRDLIGD
jgi:hypothetical protein